MIGKINDIPSVCFCEDTFSADHAMICRRGSFIIHRHNELRDLYVEMLNAMFHEIEVQPVLQEINGEVLPRGSN